MTEFEKDLMQVINKHSQENGSGTPDFVLAVFLRGCLDTYNLALKERETWYGRDVNPGIFHPINEAGMRSARELPYKKKKEEALEYP